MDVSRRRSCMESDKGSELSSSNSPLRRKMPCANYAHDKREKETIELRLTSTCDNFSVLEDSSERPSLPQRSKSSLSPRVVLDAGKSLRRTGSDVRKKLTSGRSKKAKQQESHIDDRKKVRRLRSRSIDEVLEDCGIRSEAISIISSSALSLDSPRSRSAEDMSLLEKVEEEDYGATSPTRGLSTKQGTREEVRKTVSELSVTSLPDVKHWLSSPILGRSDRSSSSTSSPKTTPPKSPSISLMPFPKPPPNIMKELKLASKEFHSSDEEEVSDLLNEWGEVLMKEYHCDLSELQIVSDPTYSPHLSQTTRVHRDNEVVCNEISQLEGESKMKSIFQEIINTEKNYLAELRKLIWVCQISVHWSDPFTYLL